MNMRPIVFLLKINCWYAYIYSLPGYTNWPTDKNFLELREKLIGNLFLPEDAKYNPWTYNLRTNNPRPAAIVQVKSREDIVQTLSFSRQYNIRIAVQSTGNHQDIRNTADNSILIDMRLMNHKEIDLKKKKITVGPGQHFKAIHNFIANKSRNTLVAVSSANLDVGPYGWAVGGGHGVLTRLYGLGADALLSLELILINGSTITVSATRHRELFRALRGSGGSAYGIAVNLTFNLFNSPGKVYIFNGTFPANSNTATQYSIWLNSTPNEAGAYYILVNYPTPHVLITAYCFGNNGDAILSPLLSISDCGTLALSDDCTIFEKSNYYEFINNLTLDKGSNRIYMISTALNNSTMTSALKKINEWVSKSTISTIGCSANSILGGVSASMDPDGEFTTVAPAMRSSLISITCWIDMPKRHCMLIAKNDYSFVNYLDEFGDKILRPYGTDEWVYWNEPQHNFVNDEDWQSRYWGGAEQYARLLKVKQTYDKNNFLTCYHCIGWNLSQVIDPAVCPSSCTCSNNPLGSCVAQVETGVCFGDIFIICIIIISALCCSFIVSICENCYKKKKKKPTGIQLNYSAISQPLKITQSWG